MRHRVRESPHGLLVDASEARVIYRRSISAADVFELLRRPLRAVGVAIHAEVISHHRIVGLWNLTPGHFLEPTNPVGDRRMRGKHRPDPLAGAERVGDHQVRLGGQLRLRG